MAQIKYGSLYYRGKKADPKTFTVGRKNLAYLTGYCRCCGRTLRGRKAVPISDSYDSDVCSDYTPVVECEECDSERAESI